MSIDCSLLRNDATTAIAAASVATSAANIHFLLPFVGFFPDFAFTLALINYMRPAPVLYVPWGVRVVERTFLGAVDPRARMWIPTGPSAAGKPGKIGSGRGFCSRREGLERSTLLDIYHVACLDSSC